ncbi:hypothetical protein MKK70_15275 [Methylobacterium sp. E-041]|uniref:hypothetical protein n=1 Tax=Methylobacterium sp. E-041 TaxID=2836573 RepID=UPI001FBB516C|nr:hypothetical protein [Methylobacterium sp. E-041]MCJ2106714.1 hypothetical protein [Methylobacterium sp. E-041]
MRYRLSIAITLAHCGRVAVAEPAPTIEHLLTDGWEIAGYVGNYDVRTSLILFKKKDVNHLVQCSTLFDVTRSQRVVVNCYELR